MAMLAGAGVGLTSLHARADDATPSSMAGDKTSIPVYDPAAGTLIDITKILDADQLEQSGYGFVTEPLGLENYPAEFGAANLVIDSLMGCSSWDLHC